jgi:hypothetical protein
MRVIAHGPKFAKLQEANKQTPNSTLGNEGKSNKVWAVPGGRYGTWGNHGILITRRRCLALDQESAGGCCNLQGLIPSSSIDTVTDFISMVLWKMSSSY